MRREGVQRAAMDTWLVELEVTVIEVNTDCACDYGDLPTNTKVAVFETNLRVR